MAYLLFDIQTIAELRSMGQPATHVSEILINLQWFPFKMMRFKVSFKNSHHLVSASICVNFPPLDGDLCLGAFLINYEMKFIDYPFHVYCSMFY